MRQRERCAVSGHSQDRDRAARFDPHQTAELVAPLLQSFGISVERGIARTGVIGTLKGSLQSDRAIALRADMDALHIEQQNNFPHVSQERGRMMPAVVTGIPRCCWTRPNTSH